MKKSSESRRQRRRNRATREQTEWIAALLDGSVRRDKEVYWVRVHESNADLRRGYDGVYPARTKREALSLMRPQRLPSWHPDYVKYERT